MRESARMPRFWRVYLAMDTFLAPSWRMRATPPLSSGRQVQPGAVRSLRIRSVLPPAVTFPGLNANRSTAVDESSNVVYSTELFPYLTSCTTDEDRTRWVSPTGANSGIAPSTHSRWRR